MKRYIIIGNGVAGASAAQEIRARDPQAAITIFSAEIQPYYYRPRLPDYLAGEVDLGKITVHSTDWYATQGIELRLDDPVREVDLAARVVASSRTQRPYDALLLATGANSFVPSLAGADKENVFTLRTVAHAKAICRAVKKAREAVLVGGGLLGLEAGYSLIRRGLKVRVVEFFNRLLPRQMDPPGAARLQAMLEDLGFGFYLGAEIQAILGGEAAQGLALADGTRIPGDMVLFSAGVRPEVGLARDMGLAVDKGVMVDQTMATSHQGVWAAGDCIQMGERFWGLWPAAKAQGAVAGANMAGGNETFTNAAPGACLKVAGVDLTCAGEVDPEGRHACAAAQGEGFYRKIVVEDGRVIGCIFLGSPRGVAETLAAMEKGTRVTDAQLKALAQPDFDFSCLTS